MPLESTQRGMSRALALRLAVVALLIVGAARIIATYPHFSQTVDEPVHIAAGMEWIEEGSFSLEPVNPPLARVAVALGPYLRGVRFSRPDEDPGAAAQPRSGFHFVLAEGTRMLHTGGDYAGNLSAARLGVIPFFLLMGAGVWLWSKRLFGETAAFLSVLLLTTLSPVLAHSGLATADSALAATFPIALLCFVDWLDKPDRRRSALFGATAGLAVLSKLNAIPFLLVAVAVLVVVRWWMTRSKGFADGRTVRMRARLTASLLAMAVAGLVIWGGYRFTVRALTTPEHRPHHAIERVFADRPAARDTANWLVEAVPVPAPDFLTGIINARTLVAEGQTEGYALGEVYPGGRWYYFPLAFAVKTPIPFLLLAAIGGVLLAGDARRSRDWRPLAPLLSAAGVLLFCLPSSINVGLRHILPMYPLLAIVAGFAIACWWQRLRRSKLLLALLIGLLAWQVVGSLAAHPDYLADFNFFAGRRPEKVLVDSDLDWGQDLLRLEALLRERGVEQLHLRYFGSADLTRHALPPFTRLEPGVRPCGWIAISERTLRIEKGYEWLQELEPEARAGRSIRLYRLGPPACN